MRLGTFTALTGLAILTLGLLAGCSSDSKTAAPVVYGANDDPLFVPVKAQIDNTITSTFGNITTGFNNLTSRPGDTTSVANQLTPPEHAPGPNGGPDSLVVTYVGGWYFISAIKSFTDYTARMRDSIEYKSNDLPVQGPNPTVDFVHYITNWAFNSTQQSQTHLDYAGRSDFQIANLDQLTAVVNGSSSRIAEVVYIAPDTTINHTYNFSLTASNLSIVRSNQGWASNCPSTGTISMALGHVYSWQRGSDFGTGSNNWTVTITMNNGTATVTAAHGSTTWRYTIQICTLPGA
jgi:hypothetical protein